MSLPTRLSPSQENHLLKLSQGSLNRDYAMGEIEGIPYDSEEDARIYHASIINLAAHVLGYIEIDKPIRSGAFWCVMTFPTPKLDAALSYVQRGLLVDTASGEIDWEATEHYYLSILRNRKLRKDNPVFTFDRLNPGEPVAARILSKATMWKLCSQGDGKFWTIPADEPHPLEGNGWD
jgi:hypothetical protein